MISEDLDREGGPGEVLSPCLKGVEDGEEFSVIDVIVPFSRGEGLREVGAWVPLAVWIGLEEYGSRGELGGIGGYGKGGIGVRKLEHGLGEEKSFQLVKRLLAGGGPVPRVIFPGEV